MQQRLQQKEKAELPDFDSRKLFLNATHTHDGPGFIDSTFKGLYDVSKNPGLFYQVLEGPLFRGGLVFFRIADPLIF